MNPSIIIPTFTNTTGLLVLLSQLSDYEGQVIVVDNKPSDEKNKGILGLDSRLRGNDKVLYLPQTKNLGFAKGVNTGAKHATGEWLAILNDDIVLPSSNTLLQLISYADKKKWDAVSPVLKKPDGKIENYGYTVLPIGKVELNVKNYRLDSRLRGNDAKGRSGQALDSRYLDGITAACLLIKKSVFDEMKGFDESFFAYLEDVDLFLRIKKAGYSFGICPDIAVIHNHMSTSSKMGWFKEKQDFINWFRVIGKNWGIKKIILYFPGIVLERLRNMSGLMKKIVKTVTSSR